MVFHEKDFLHRANVTLTVSWFVLFGLYMGSWCMVCVLLHLFGYRWEWLWPDPAHSALRADFGNINPCLRDQLVVRLRHRCRV